MALSSGNPFIVEMIKTDARKPMAYYRARYRYPGPIADSARDHRAIATLTAHVQFDQVTVMDLLAALG